MSTFNSLAQQGQVSHTGYILGHVIDNNDPERRQRVKVLVPGLFEGPVAQIPWILPSPSSAFGMNGSCTSVNVPEVGTPVRLQLQNGDPAYGVLEGYVQTEAVLKDPELYTNYPHRRGWRDPARNLFYIDTSAGVSRIFLRHSSGTTISIDTSGQVTVQCVKSVVLTAEENIQASATNISLNASNSIALSAGSSISLQAPQIGAEGSLRNNGVNVGSTHRHPVPGVDTGSSTVTSNNPQ